MCHNELSKRESSYLRRQYFFLTLRPHKICNEISSPLIKQFVDRMRNVEVRKDFLADELVTLHEAKKVARLKEVISDAVLASLLDVLAQMIAETWARI